MKRYLLFFCVVLLGLMEKSIGCSMRDSTGGGTWDFADEYLYLNKNCYETGSCVFECGNGSGNGDFCPGGAIVYIKGKTAAYIGNNGQSVNNRAFKCTDGWSDQLWQYYDLSGLYFCDSNEIKEGKVEKIDDYDRDKEIYYRVDRVNRASTSDVDWYAGDKDSFCLFYKKRLLEAGRDFYTNEEITGETDSDAENSSGSSSEVKDKSTSGTEKNEEKKNSDVKSGGDETNSDTDNVKIVEEQDKIDKDRADGSKKITANKKVADKSWNDCGDYVVAVWNWLKNGKKGTCPQSDTMNICDDVLVELFVPEVADRDDWLVEAEKTCNGQATSANDGYIQILGDPADFKGYSCDDWNTAEQKFCCKSKDAKNNDKGVCSCTDTSKTWKWDEKSGKGACVGKEYENKGKDKDAKKTDDSKNESKKQELKKPVVDAAKLKAANEAREKLNTFFKKIDSDRSVWKNADGSFNATRLASDLTAGVVLGTVGGVVSGVLIKKSQVEKGFDALNCSINGQKVADWGDEFSVGLRR